MQLLLTQNDSVNKFTESIHSSSRHRFHQFFMSRHIVNIIDGQVKRTSALSMTCQKHVYGPYLPLAPGTCFHPRKRLHEENPSWKATLMGAFADTHLSGLVVAPATQRAFIYLAHGLLPLLRQAFDIGPGFK